MDSGNENVRGESSASVKNSAKVQKRKSNTHHAAKKLSLALKTYGAQRPDEIARAMELHKLPQELPAYVNALAIEAEERVLERMQHNPEFVQCTSWSELLGSEGFRETCNNELPLALQTIAYTENFPDMQKAKGVDFQLLYLNLASMMMGQPVRSMNAVTQKFLKQVYEETAAQASKMDQKEELAFLHDQLKRMRKPTPSKTDPKDMTDLNRFFSDPNINPFQLPLDKICPDLP